MEKIIIFVQFEGIVYQQIVGIPMATNWAPLIAELFLFWEGFYNVLPF